MNILNTVITKVKKNKAILFRLILLPALGLEIAAYMMSKGSIPGNAEMVNRLTAGGAILVLGFLVINGLFQKYTGMSWRMNMAANAAQEKSQESEEKNGMKE